MTTWSQGKASCFPRHWSRRLPGSRSSERTLAFWETSSHLHFILLAGKPSDGNGFQLLLPDGDVNQGLQTEIASRLNSKCLGTFYFCPGCLLRAIRLSNSEPSCKQFPRRARGSSSRAFHCSSHGQLLVFPQMACIDWDGLHSPKMACIYPVGLYSSSMTQCKGSLYKRTAFSAATVAVLGSRGWVTTPWFSPRSRLNTALLCCKCQEKAREILYLIGFI